MSHCRDEHTDNHTHTHDHSDDLTPALQNHIYSQIDFDNTTTLNESTPDAGAQLLRKAWSERLEPLPELRSANNNTNTNTDDSSDDENDAQLLMHIPFTGQIRLHSLLIRTSATSGTAPRTVHLYANREGLDFGAASEVEATQTLCVARSNAVQEIPVKRARFNAVRTLDLFFEDNWGGDYEEDGGEVRVSYLGFKGEWMKLSREPVSFLYEAAANPKDHQLASGVGERVGSGIGGGGGGHGM